MGYFGFLCICILTSMFFKNPQPVRQMRNVQALSD
jgi:hypothetical protein